MATKNRRPKRSLHIAPFRVPPMTLGNRGILRRRNRERKRGVPEADLRCGGNSILTPMIRQYIDDDQPEKGGTLSGNLERKDFSDLMNMVLFK